jgi:hypothetical protein
MIGETILHYPPKADQPQADKILEKLGEALLRLSLHTEIDKTKVCFVGQDGFVRRSLRNNLEMSNDR